MTIKYCINCGTKLDAWLKSCPKCNTYIPLLFPKKGPLRIKYISEDDEIAKKNKENINSELNYLKPYLYSDEEILYYYIESSTALSTEFSRILGGIFFGFPSVLILTIYLFFLTSDVFLLVLFFDLFLMVYTTYLISYGLFNFHRLKKIVNLSYREIKKYNNLYVITSKRWIQKSLETIDLNLVDFPENIIERKKDFVYIDLNYIQIKYSKMTYKNPEKRLDDFFVEIGIFLKYLNKETKLLQIGGFHAIRSYFNFSIDKLNEKLDTELIERKDYFELNLKKRNSL